MVTYLKIGVVAISALILLETTFSSASRAYSEGFLFPDGRFSRSALLQLIFGWCVSVCLWPLFLVNLGVSFYRYLRTKD